MNILEVLVSLYAPHTCVGCGNDGAVLCAGCLRGLPPAMSRCYRCHNGAAAGRTCVVCLRYGLQSVRPAVRYVGAARQAVWQLKYQRAQAAAVAMAESMVAAAPAPLRSGSVLVVPAPTAASRRRVRGYDQAARLARAYSRQAGLTYAPLLIRLGHQKQVGAGRTQRQSQLRGAFQVKPAWRSSVRGQHIVLVDDVVTTGATLETAANVLLAAGARSVEAVVFAQA